VPWKGDHGNLNPMAIWHQWIEDPHEKMCGSWPVIHVRFEDLTIRISRGMTWIKW
jgi:hypothetical protein